MRQVVVLKVLSKQKTNNQYETKWVFEDKVGHRYEWWTTSVRVLIVGSWYEFSSELIGMQSKTATRTLINPRGFRKTVV